MTKERNPDTWGRGHARMKANERAKQFLPFAAVRGLPEAMALVEERIPAEQEKAAQKSTELPIHQSRDNV